MKQIPTTKALDYRGAKFAKAAITFSNDSCSPIYGIQLFVMDEQTHINLDFVNAVDDGYLIGIRKYLFDPFLNQSLLMIAISVMIIYEAPIAMVVAMPFPIIGSTSMYLFSRKCGATRWQAFCMSSTKPSVYRFVRAMFTAPAKN